MKEKDNLALPHELEEKTESGVNRAVQRVRLLRSPEYPFPARSVKRVDVFMRCNGWASGDQGHREVPEGQPKERHPRQGVGNSMLSRGQYQERSGEMEYFTDLAVGDQTRTPTLASLPWGLGSVVSPFMDAPNDLISHRIGRQL